MIVPGRRRTAIAALIVTSLLIAVAAGDVWGRTRHTPQDPGPQGIALFLQGRYAQALPLLQRAVNLRPRSDAAWSWLGACYVRMGQLAKGRRALDRALRLNPRNPAALFYLGLAYQLGGDVARARQLFQQVLSVAPGSEHAASAAQWLARSGAVPASPTPAQAAQPAAPPSPPAVSPSPSASRRPSAAVSPTSPETAGSECLPAPALALVPKAPPPMPAFKDLPNVYIETVHIDLDGEQLVAHGKAGNAGVNDARELTIRAVGYGIKGTPVAQGETMIPRSRAGRRDSDFEIPLRPTRVPVYWLRASVVSYSPRTIDDRLHSREYRVPVGTYLSWVRTLVRIGVGPVPQEAASSHVVCAAILSTGELPVASLDVAVAFTGQTEGRILQVEETVTLVPGHAGAIRATWPVPVALKAADTRILKVRFSGYGATDTGEHHD